MQKSFIYKSPHDEDYFLIAQSYLPRRMYRLELQNIHVLIFNIAIDTFGTQVSDINPPTWKGYRKCDLLKTSLL